MKKNYIKRFNFNALELDNLILKLYFNNKILNKSSITWASQVRYSIGKNSSITLIRNNCIITGRNRGVIKSYKLSRFEFKKLARANNWVNKNY